MGLDDFVAAHVKAFNDHDAEAWTSHYAEGAVLHDPQYPEPQRGKAAVLKDIQEFFVAFPDVHFETRTVVGSESRGAIDGVGRGTHRGPMAGPAGTIPATHKRMEVPYASFVELNSEGLIEEERRYYDVAGMLHQLGLMRHQAAPEHLEGRHVDQLVEDEAKTSTVAQLDDRPDVVLRENPIV